MHLKAFALSALDSATNGGRRYHLWMGFLTLFIIAGGVAYAIQLRDGQVQVFGRVTQGVVR